MRFKVIGILVGTNSINFENKENKKVACGRGMIHRYLLTKPYINWINIQMQDLFKELKYGVFCH